MSMFSEQEELDRSESHGPDREGSEEMPREAPTPHGKQESMSLGKSLKPLNEDELTAGR